MLAGFILFFILEQFIRWHHCGVKCEEERPFSYLVLLSDTLHNFIVGPVIAASFLIGPSVGLVTTIAIALHEIPQKIGDFGVLVYGGFSKWKASIFNFLTGLTIILGGLIGLALAGKIGEAIIYLLPFAARNFIYIAASDLIPEIKHKVSGKESINHFVFFLISIGLMLAIKFL